MCLYWLPFAFLASPTLIPFPVDLITPTFSWTDGMADWFLSWGFALETGGQLSC